MLKVTKEQRRALMLSRNKWKRIVEKGAKDNGTDDCPCCKLWYSKVFGCDGCPIAKHTGRDGCEGTPYIKWMMHQTDQDEWYPFTVFNAKSKRLAQAELDFLQDLLDECEVVADA